MNFEVIIMNRRQISTNDLKLNPMKSWAEDWLLLASGSFKTNNFNMMTVAWGGYCVMWTKPIAMIVVRPSRFTFSFIEKNDFFTLSAFPEEYKKNLTICGTKSGRDFDKKKSSGLTPEAGKKIDSPSFAEAELIIECKKIYFDDFKPSNFLSKDIEPQYNGSDYHRMYFGEIIYIEATEKCI